MEGLRLRAKEIGAKKAILLIACFLWLLQTAALFFFQLRISYYTYTLVSQNNFSYESVREQDDWYKFIQFCQKVIPSNGVYLFQGDWERGHKLRYYLYPRVYIDGRGLGGDSAILQRIREEQVTHIIVHDKAAFASSELLNDSTLFKRVDYNSEQAILVVNRDALETLPWVR